jgi:hypothetical protein
VFFILGPKEKWRRSKPPIDTLTAFDGCLKKEFTDNDQTEIRRRAVTASSRRATIPTIITGRC